MNCEGEEENRLEQESEGEVMYIELEKAIGVVNGAFKFEVETPDNYREIAVETLKLLPSVEVVRCGECKYKKLCEEVTFEYKGEKGYCSRGEKE